MTESEVLDVCETKEQHEVTQVYISSINYPTITFLPMTSCTCYVSSQDDVVFLEILDFSLPLHDPQCISNYVYVTGTHFKRCGHLDGDRLPETLEISNSDVTTANVTVKFVSDGKGIQQDRGFWLEFRGNFS